MEQKIIDGNKKIAEFDGLTKDTYGKFFKNGVFKGYNESEFQYHKSWDWLMLVIEKIESLGFKFQICRKRITIVEDKGTELHVETIKEDSKMKSAWVAVVEFIKWYDDNAVGSR